MKKLTIPNITGFLLACIGLFFLTSWYLHLSNFTVIFAETEGVLIVGISFLLSGIVFLILDFHSRWQTNKAIQEHEKRLLHMAYHDTLTGLANRNKLEQATSQILNLANRKHTGFALIFLDLDHFKNINDTLGHDAGDFLLQIVAGRLKNTIRNSDIVARLGGDEFVIMIVEVQSIEAAAKVAQKILDCFLQPIVIKEYELYITTSMGISFYPHDGENIQTLMKNADLALYRAKEHGRNNYQFCTPEMTAKARDKMMRQNALAHALMKHEFILHYQPTMDLKSHKLTGLEALLRWQSKEYGLVTAQEIIFIAEETGLIVPLSEWILRTACKQVKLWQDNYLVPFTLAVNLSLRQFKQSNFVEGMLRILHETGFNAKNLEIEITENLIMQDLEGILPSLLKLKSYGIQIAIDDFGTGHSSLGYLKRFSVDKIKIDRTFIQDTSEAANASLVSAIIAMANKLNIKTIAEGVETKEQYQFLLKEHCSEMQGYYLSPPAEVKEISKILEDFTSAEHYLKILAEKFFTPG